MTTLRSERLTLRPLAFSDAAQLLPALRDEANMRYWSRGPLATVDEVREYISYNVEGKGVQSFAITETARQEAALGWVILIDRGEKKAELGYILRPDAQGRGIAREAIGCVLDHAFASRGLRRIYADIDPENQRSIDAMLALGFAYEGRLRATWETHIGVRDSVIYSLLRSDRE